MIITKPHRKMKNKPPTLSYWQNLRNEYEKIISETTDKEHKKKTKEALKIVNQKIKNIAK